MIYFWPMAVLRTLLSLALAASPPVAASALAHGGGLDANGCHNDRKRGGYHCHGSGAPVREAPSTRQTPPNAVIGRFSYRNCSEARAVGAAPVRRGQPGYGPHLDRDGDGIGCE